MRIVSCAVSMWWLLSALLSPILYAAANILDEFLANRRLPNLPALLFYASLFNLAELPIIFLIDPLVIPSPFLCAVIVFLGLANFLYLYPYYRALQVTDTSVVISLFSLSNIFIPLLSFLVVGERLGVWQYVGFTVIIVASTLLTFEPKKFRPGSALGLMLFSSFMVTAQGIGFKYVFEQGVSWGTALGGQAFFAFVCVLPMLAFQGMRQKIADGYKMFRKSLPLFVLEEVVSLGAGAAATYAIMLVPLTIEKTVESFQPVFVLIFALMFAPFFPKVFKEQTDPKHLPKKIFFFLIMGFGVWLMAS